VLDNGDLNEVTWEQREMEGDPFFVTSQRLPRVPYAKLASALGLASIHLDDPAAVGAAWDQALSADRPCLIHAVVDPAVPLLPPRVEPETRTRLLTALERERTALAARACALVLAELADQEA